MKTLVLFCFAWFAAVDGFTAWDDVLKEADQNKDNAHTFQSGSEYPNNTSNAIRYHLAGIDLEIPATSPGSVHEMLEKGCAIEKMLPDSSPQKAPFVSKFSEIFLNIGDYVNAERLAIACVDLSKRTSGSTTLEHGLCLVALARVYEYIGDYDSALTAAEESLGVFQKKGSSSETGVLEGNIALYKLRTGDKAGAREFVSRSLDKAQRSVNKADVIKPLHVSGQISMAEGDYKKAINALEQCMTVISDPETRKPPPGADVRTARLIQVEHNAILDSAKTHLCQDLLNMYVAIHDPANANRIENELKGCEDAGSIGVVKSDWFISGDATRILLSDQNGEKEKARGLAKTYITAQNSRLSTALSMNEKQRIAWAKNNLEFGIPIEFCNQRELADCVLRWKGVVLDSLISDRSIQGLRNGADFENRLCELRKYKQQLAQLELSGQSSANKSLCESTRKQINNLEKGIYGKVSGGSGLDIVKDVSIEKIQGLLDQNTVLIEYIVYRELPDRLNGRELVGALLIGANKDPIWIPLGEVNKIRQLTDRFSTSLKSINVTDIEIEEQLVQLYKNVFEPVEKFVPHGKDHIIVSTDGVTNFVPFGSLLDSNNAFLCSRYNLSFIGSARDLLKKQSPPKEESVLIVANPKFNKTTDESILLHPLPGTAAEAKSIEQIAKDQSITTKIFEGENASKKNLISQKAGLIMHIASHGFFLDANVPSFTSVATRGMSVKGIGVKTNNVGSVVQIDPMLRSGLALAGAENTLKQWRAGEFSDPKDNGILTAEEVAGMDLKGTWLVTLSCCESGLGVSSAGEGVFGLRRAFMMSGAQNLLMTLWPVSDETTAKIMADFYKEALVSRDAPGALANVQRDWLVRLRREKGTISAVRDAGPFVMMCSGKLPHFTK